MRFTYPADPIVSPRIAAAFDEFAASIAPYGFSSDLWEDHLDAVLTELRNLGHYPADPERE